MADTMLVMGRLYKRVRTVAGHTKLVPDTILLLGESFYDWQCTYDDNREALHVYNVTTQREDKTYHRGSFEYEYELMDVDTIQTLAELKETKALDLLGVKYEIKVIA